MGTLDGQCASAIADESCTCNNGTITRIIGRGFFTGTNQPGLNIVVQTPETYSSSSSGGQFFACDPFGNFFFTDSVGGIVRSYDLSTGNTEHVIGGAAPIVVPAAANPFEPGTFVYDAAGDMYIADLANERVLRYVAAGPTLTEYTTLLGGSPRGLAFDSTGNLFVALLPPVRTVVRVPPGGGAGTAVPHAGSGVVGAPPADDSVASAANFGTLADLAIDRFDQLYICDITADTVWRVHPDTLRIYAHIGTPGGVATPPASVAGGTLYRDNKVLFNPLSMAFDADGNAYVGQTGSVLYVDNAAGTVEVLVGSGNVAVGGDGGDALAAEIGNAQGVFVDERYHLYVSNAYTGLISDESSVHRVDAPAGCDAVPAERRPCCAQPDLQSGTNCVENTTLAECTTPFNGQWALVGGTTCDTATFAGPCTFAPTHAPSRAPTASPTPSPTLAPTTTPTASPLTPTASPTPSPTNSMPSWAAILGGTAPPPPPATPVGVFAWWRFAEAPVAPTALLAETAAPGVVANGTWQNADMALGRQSLVRGDAADTAVRWARNVPSPPPPNARADGVLPTMGSVLSSTSWAVSVLVRFQRTDGSSAVTPFDAPSSITLFSTSPATLPAANTEFRLTLTAFNFSPAQNGFACLPADSTGTLSLFNTGPLALTTNTMYMVACVADASTIYLYVNGVLEASQNRNYLASGLQSNFDSVNVEFTPLVVSEHDVAPSTETALVDVELDELVVYDMFSSASASTWTYLYGAATECPDTPTASPTTSPSASPTASPTASPSASPTVSPTSSPTASPVVCPISWATVLDGTHDTSALGLDVYEWWRFGETTVPSPMAAEVGTVGDGVWALPPTVVFGEPGAVANDADTAVYIGAGAMGQTVGEIATTAAVFSSDAWAFSMFVRMVTPVSIIDGDLPTLFSSENSATVPDTDFAVHMRIIKAGAVFRFVCSAKNPAGMVVPAVSPTAIVFDRDYFVVCEGDAVDITLYVDGVAVAATGRGAVPLGLSSNYDTTAMQFVPMYVAEIMPLAREFSVRIDELVIYNSSTPAAWPFLTALAAANCPPLPTFAPSASPTLAPTLAPTASPVPPIALSLVFDDIEIYEDPSAPFEPTQTTGTVCRAMSTPAAISIDVVSDHPADVTHDATVAIGANNACGMFTVSVVQDDDDEGVETVTFTVSVAGGGYTSDMETLDIRDDDGGGGPA